MAKPLFDYGEFKKLYDSFANISSGLHNWLINFLKKEAMRALRETKLRTPVDTGYLEREWQISDVEIVGDVFMIYLLNPVEYAMYVEFGHRTPNGGWVEGYHMAEVSIAHVQDSMPDRFEREFSNWLKANGVG